MEGTAFSIDEASFDASLLPEGSRRPGSEAFHRAVTDYFQKSYASMGGQLSVVRRRPDRGGLGAGTAGSTGDGHDRAAPAAAAIR